MKDIREYLKKVAEEEPSRQVVNTLVDLVKDLLARVDRLQSEVDKLRSENVQLREELSRYKNLPPRPKIEPSKLEKAKTPSNRKENWKKGAKNIKLIDNIDETVKLSVPCESIPTGALFKGYRDVVIQDLVISKKVTCYKLEQWQRPDGTYICAELPGAVVGSQFGPGLRHYIVHQCYANRVTQNRILADLRDKGISISAGQIDAILKEAATQLKPEKEALLQAGLQSKYFQADDTGTRHKGKNCFTTVLCNEFFAYFKSSTNKSRINFLEVLCQGTVEYSFTQDSLDYVQRIDPTEAMQRKIRNLIGTKFSNTIDLNTFFTTERWGKSTCKTITEAGLFGSLLERGQRLPGIILMSDAAGQFKLFEHILCWIHVERSIKRLVPVNDQDRQEIEATLGNFWNFYRALKAYKENPSEDFKKDLEKRFDEIFSFKASECPLAQALKKIRDCKHQLLLVLEHPDIPLHNNTSEQNIREFVTKRKISGCTRSDAGRDALDTFISLLKTCKKLGISFWQYLEDRTYKTNRIASLADIVLVKIRAISCAGP